MPFPNPIAPMAPAAPDAASAKGTPPVVVAPSTNDSGLLFRPAAERFHSQHGWLDSWHSFSFADHFDPNWMGFGPLRVINDDRIAAGRGFGMHPHRDMEIITVLVDGALEHQDSLGHSSTLRAGEVQRMSAGTGIVHSEINTGERPCHLLQIWIEPSRRGIPPSYEQRPFPSGPGWTLLLDPQAGGDAMTIERPVRLRRGRLEADSGLDLPLGPEAQGWIQMIAGAVELQVDGPSDPRGGRLQAGDGLGLAAGHSGAIKGLEAGTDLLWFELR